jgi:hypothetical protein
MMAKAVCKCIMTAFVVSVLLQPCYSQDFADLEEQAVRLISTYRTTPDVLAVADIQSCIDDLGEHTSSIPMEIFKKEYYSGYLYYIRGLIASDAGSLNSAESKFDTAYTVYQNAVGLPKHRVFCKFMKGWCKLRSYLLPGDRPIGLLTQAVTDLENTLAEPESNFIRDDILFLKGYCNYLKTYSQYMTQEDNTDAVTSALTDFQAIGQQSPLWDIAQYFVALAYYISSQSCALAVLTCQPDCSAPCDGFEQSFNIFNGFDPNSPLIENARLGYSLSYLQKQVCHHQPVDRNAIDASVHVLLQSYVYLLTGQNPPNVAGCPECKFWVDYASYLGYLGNGTTIPNNVFLNCRTDDWRHNYIVAQAKVLRNESRLVRGNFNIVSVPQDSLIACSFIPDCLSIFPWNNPRRKSNLQNRCAALVDAFNNQGHDVTNWNVVNFLTPGFLNTPFTSVFGQNPQHDLIKDLGEYLMVLGEKRRDLYPIAYICFLYLEQHNYQPEKMLLLRTMCRYKAGGYSEADNILTDARINGLTSDSLKREANYYKARIKQQVTGDLAHEDVKKYMERIRSTDPRAEWYFSYTLKPLTPDRDGVCRVWNQTQNDCSLQWLNGFAQNEITKHGFTCNPDPAAAGTIQLAAHDVRFDVLETQMDKYIESEKKFLRRFWQVYSLPLIKLYPDGADGQVAGPREFFIESEFPVVLRVGREGTQKKMWVIGGDGGEYTTTTGEIEIEVRSSVQYTIISRIQGHYPAIVEAVFTQPGQEVVFNYDTAMRITGNPTLDCQEYTICDYADNHFLVAPQDESYFAVTKDNCSSVQLNLSGGYQGAYTGITRLGDLFYTINRSFNSMYSFASSGGKVNDISLAADILSGPSDIVGYDNYMYVANSGDKRILKFSVSGSSVNLEATSTGSFGTIEGLEIVGDRVFACDWGDANIYWGGLNLGTFQSLCAIDEARREGLVAPIKISNHEDKYLLVSDAVSGKIFLFHRIGEFLDVFSHSDIRLPRKADLSYVSNTLRVCQSNGWASYSLIPDNDYLFEPTCITTVTGTQQVAGDIERSRFQP